MVGVVMEKLGPRKGEMTDMTPTDRGPVRLRFRIPARGLFGYRSEFLTDTRGEGTLHHTFKEYGPWAGDLVWPPAYVRSATTADARGSNAVRRVEGRASLNSIRPVEQRRR